jgi:predicted Fe-S protein YdhL (DUF1289 family)
MSDGENTTKITPSPCQGICTLDTRVKHCIICYRTLPEIGSWLQFDDTKKEAVWEQLGAREEGYKTFVKSNGFVKGLPKIVVPHPIRKSPFSS